MAIEKLYIEGGGSAVGGVMIGLGLKDKPVHMSRGTSFSDLLSCVVRRPMVMYDTGKLRAWLVDGASALLHLVRASINRDRADPVYQSKWVFDGQFRGSSAIEILSHPDNLDIKLYRDRRQQTETGSQDVFHYFQDRVQDIIRNVEILMDCQVQAAARDGYWVSGSGSYFKKNAVGFDFWDVAKPEFHTFRRFHTIPIWGYGWVDYIRSMGALIVFGDGFGELIRPETPGGLCPDWASIPAGEDLLCTSISTLKAAQRAIGGSCLQPGELTSEIFWSSRGPLFAPCPCLSTTQRNRTHTDPVQILLRKVELWKLRLTSSAASVGISLFDLGDRGAVVFGHTPYHKTVFGRGMRGLRDNFLFQSQSSIGSSSSDMTRSFLSMTGVGVPSTILTTPSGSQARSSVQFSGREDEPSDDEGTPTDTRKRKNPWYKGGWAKKIRSKR